MNLIRRVLCPIDFSDASDAAMGLAARLEAWYHAELHALHVVPTRPAESVRFLKTGVPAVEGSPEWIAEQADKSAAPRADGRSRSRRVYALGEGDAAREIVAYAYAKGADLIVMGRCGQSSADGDGLGAVAEGVLRRAACPVMTVAHALPDIDSHAPPFRTVLCALDFFAPSSRTLALAISFAQQADADLSVLHVLEGPCRRELIGRSHLSIADYERFVESETGARFRPAVVGPVEWSHVRERIRSGEQPAQEIIQAARDDRADLIVMSAGAVAAQVILGAACPVVSVNEVRSGADAEEAGPAHETASAVR